MPFKQLAPFQNNNTITHKRLWSTRIQNKYRAQLDGVCRIVLPKFIYLMSDT